MSNKQLAYLVGSIVAVVALLIFSFVAFEVVTVKGNEIGVLESWSGGVEDKPYHPKTYFLFPGWTQKLYTYDASTQVFVMSDDHKVPGWDAEPYKVSSAEGQDMWISLSLRWHIDPAKVVDLHKSVRTDIEAKVIRTEVELVVKNEATSLPAIAAYSGEGLVKLQAEILKELSNPDGVLRKRGIVVENFVISNIRLDEKYIGEIRARQVATQQKLRADEETKASQAMALKAKADAQADYNRRVVEAERDKQVGVLKAEEEAQKQVLAAKAAAEKTTVAAEADKRRNVLSAEGDRESGLLRAQAIEALGKAEAEATKLKLSAYAVPGAEAFVKVEVASKLAKAYGGIKGYLPSDMKVHLLTESFIKSVEGLMGKPPERK